MYTRYNSGQQNEKYNTNPLKNYEYQTKEMKTVRFGIPKPIKQKQNDSTFSKTTNYQIQNNYFIKAEPGPISIPYDIRTNENYRIKKIVFQDNNPNEYQMTHTERYKYNDGVVVYKKKISNDVNYNNNSVYFTNPINNNTKKQINNNKNNVSNYAFKVSKGTTPLPEKKNIHYNYSSKMLNFKRDKPLNNPKEKTYEVKRDNNNNTNNYQFVNIKYKSNQNNQNKNKTNFNMTTPNNSRIHTIIYTNRQDITPQKLFGDDEEVYTRKIYKKQRNIPEEINNYFTKRKISYGDRSKYINAALLIQTTYRNFKKKGKIQFNFIKKYVKYYRAIEAIQGIYNNKKNIGNYLKTN